MLEQSTALSPATEAGFARQTIGPTEVSAQRVIVGDPEDAARGLVEWFDKNELLVVQRQQPGRITFEPLTGMQAARRRGGLAFGSNRPKFMLSRATLVSGTFTRLESGYCHVALTADLRQARQGFIGGAFAAGSVGVAAAIVLATLSPFWVVTIPPLLVGGAAGWFTLKRFRPLAERAALGLERALDYLERGGVKPGHQLPARGGGIIDAIAGEIRKAIVSSTERGRTK
jgi:hypothetical protein